MSRPTILFILPTFAMFKVFHDKKLERKRKGRGEGKKGGKEKGQSVQQQRHSPEDISEEPFGSVTDTLVMTQSHQKRLGGTGYGSFCNRHSCPTFGVTYQTK